MDSVVLVAQALWLENYAPPPDSSLTWERLPHDVRALFMSGASDVVAAIGAVPEVSSEDALEVAARSLAAARMFSAPWDLLSDEAKTLLRGRVACGLRALHQGEVHAASLPAA